jgi:arylsulfatase/arylsulfatase A
VVAELRAAYEAWFEDVSHTRPDNYAPPRIVIGTVHEPFTTLTRQDWRHVKGRPWAPDSNGFWELEVGVAGEYDVRLRFPSTEAPGTARLVLGEAEQTAGVPGGAEEITFATVHLDEGPLRLQATLAFGDETRGPGQVDVRRPAGATPGPGGPGGP